MRLLCVAPELLDRIWPHVKHFIREAYFRTDEGCFAECEWRIFQVKALLWIVWNGEKITGAAVTRITKTDCSKVCTLEAAGGSLAGASTIDVIEDYAKQQGCDCVRIPGRKGWARIMKNYKVRAVVLERRLND